MCEGILASIRTVSRLTKRWSWRPSLPHLERDVSEKKDAPQQLLQTPPSVVQGFRYFYVKNPWNSLFLVSSMISLEFQLNITVTLKMCNELVSVWPFTASVIFAFYDVNSLWGRMDTIEKHNKTSLKLSISSCRNNIRLS